jgi:hypothetical protein
LVQAERAAGYHGHDEIFRLLKSYETAGAPPAGPLP